jgi:hypothetical protein
MPETRRAEVLQHMRSSESAVLAPAVLAFLSERLCLHAAQPNANSSQACASPTARVEADGRRPASGTQLRSRFERLIGWMR